MGSHGPEATMKAEGAAAFYAGKARDAYPTYPEGQQRFVAWWQDGYDAAKATARTSMPPGSRASVGIVAEHNPASQVRWTITNQLRWYAPDDAYSASESVLQQLHQASDGAERWVTVPLVSAADDAQRGRK